MKQVYLTEYDDKDRESQVFSSKTKALSHFNREFDKPDFQLDRESGITLVSVNKVTAGWITKKLVQ